ncbi:MAG: hypothetical protein AB9836_10040 [Aminipila sp.]
MEFTLSILGVPKVMKGMRVVDIKDKRCGMKFIGEDDVFIYSKEIC